MRVHPEVEVTLRGGGGGLGWFRWYLGGSLVYMIIRSLGMINHQNVIYGMFCQTRMCYILRNVIHLLNHVYSTNGPG